MKHVKTFENFTPIKINSAKPFKVKKNIGTSISYLQKGIKSLRGRLEKQKSAKKRSKMNQDINSRIKKLNDLSFKQLKQAEHFRNNPIKENLENQQTETLLSILKSPDFKAEDVLTFIGFDENEYSFKREYNWKDGYYPSHTKDGFEILFKMEELEKLMDIENGFLNYITTLSEDNYSQNYEVDDEELDYLHNYTSEEAKLKIKKLAKLFKYKLKLDNNDNIDEGEMYKLFMYLGLKSDLDDFKTEISYANERAISKAARELIKSLPFEFDKKYDDVFNCDLSFDYETLIEYLEKNHMEVKTIKEMLENLSESDEFDYDFEYEDKYEYLDYTDLEKQIESSVSKYLDSPDEIFTKLIEIDNLKAFKSNVKLAYFDYKYDKWVDYNRVNWNLFEFAKHYSGEILKWLKTDEFEKIIESRSKAELDEYNKFIFDGNMQKYNL